MDDNESPAADLSVVSESVAIAVDGDGVGGVQLCPSLVMGSQQALPAAVKHIYSRLAASASQVDEGMPDLMLSLVSDGNQLSQRYLGRVESSLSPLITNCCLWVVTSGEHNDPLAKAASNTIKNVLPQTEGDVETLHIVVNSYDVVASQGVREGMTQMVDTSLNTLLLLCQGELQGRLELARFRALAVRRLAHPPPALLIGVPSEPISTGMTPSGSAPPILLSPSDDKRPLPAVVYAGASLASLAELTVYLESGFPIIILKDSCELCAVLHNAFMLYRTPQFEHTKFVQWLQDQLNAISIEDVLSARKLIIKILAIGFGDIQLVEFLDIDEMLSLPCRIVDLFLQCYGAEAHQVVQIAAQINEPSILGGIDIEEVLDDELLTTILCTTVSCEARVSFLSAILERKTHLSVSSEMLLKMSRNADKHFFNTIVLCQCMGYSSVPEDIDEQFINDVNKLMTRLSFGIQDLFSPSAFNNDILQKNHAASIKILAIWSLLLHRPSMVRCLCAFSDEPIMFALVLSRVAKSLANEARDWFFYEESFSRLSSVLSSTSVDLLDIVHKKTPTKAYELLCEPLECYSGKTICEVAFQLNMRCLVSHECCQRWVNRLLYGQLQATTSPTFIARWAKILIAAIFVIPIRWWISLRPSCLTSYYCVDKISPTVALLDAGRQPRRVRAVSTYSIISGRSEAVMTTAQSIPLAHQMTSGVESATPQSMVFPLNIEDIDSDPGQKKLFKKSPINRRTPPSLGVFYSTPIVKYWLSFVFRLLHIMLLAYSVLLPGCGLLLLDAVVWIWTFMAWIEALWVLNVRSQTIPLSLMLWRVLDCSITFLYLLTMLSFKFVGEGPIAETLFVHSAYPVRVISSFFLLYWCYSTIFFYIPLSDLFGPIVIRVKLMILRDFTNFLIMVALIMTSSAAAIHAVLYPDQDFSIAIIRSSLSWVWLSLFTTDLSSLKESDSCRKTFLGSPTEYCQSLGEYSNTSCPSQSWASYFVILEYFVLLKLILWPILFAFFAKTAKSVDEEADKIWKLQMYSLVTDFSVRPPFPPPLTPLFFLCLACCRVRGRLSGMLIFNAVDHPDVDYKDKIRTTVRFGSVYRNPSVPFKKNEFINAFWRRLAIERWKEDTQNRNEDFLLKEVLFIQRQLRMLMLNMTYDSGGNQKSRTVESIPYNDSAVSRLSISPSERSWDVLIPWYSPPFYCKPAEEFPNEISKHVEAVIKQNINELCRVWRIRQAQDTTSGNSWMLSAAGYPLNPFGRRGMAGRGCHPKFGANKRCYYIILSGQSKSNCKVLLDLNNSLPNWTRPGGGSKDEHFASILKNIGITDRDAQLLSMRRSDRSMIPPFENVLPSDTGATHIALLPVEHEIDTDNAWTEQDVWALALMNRRVLSTIAGYSWNDVNALPLLFQKSHAELISKALRVFNIE